MYPDAKVVLTEHTSAALWLKSWRGIGFDPRSYCFRWIGYWVPGVVAANDLYWGWMRLVFERFGMALSGQRRCTVRIITGLGLLC